MIYQLRYPIRKTDIHQYGGLLKPPRTTNESVDKLSNQFIDALKNIAILTVTSPTVIKVPIRGLLAVETILLFCGWQNLDINRLDCKQ